MSGPIIAGPGPCEVCGWTVGANPACIACIADAAEDAAADAREEHQAGRRLLDFYPTPRWMTNHLLDRLDLNVPPGAWPACRCDGADIIASIRRGDPGWVQGPRHESGCPGLRPPRILEPCVGEGHIVRAIRDRYPEAAIVSNDLQRYQGHAPDFLCDAATDELWDIAASLEDPFDWVITNPPFSAAFDIAGNAYDAAQVGMAMLLRVTWLEPTRTGFKARWLAEHPPRWELIMERYSFDGSGKQDSAPAAWFVWFKDPAVPFRIEIIPGRGGGAQEKLL